MKQDATKIFIVALIYRQYYAATATRTTKVTLKCYKILYNSVVPALPRHFSTTTQGVLSNTTYAGMWLKIHTYSQIGACAAVSNRAKMLWFMKVKEEDALPNKN